MIFCLFSSPFGIRAIITLDWEIPAFSLISTAFFIIIGFRIKEKNDRYKAKPVEDLYLQIPERILPDRSDIDTLL